LDGNILLYLFLSIPEKQNKKIESQPLNKMTEWCCWWGVCSDGNINYIVMVIFQWC